MSEAISVLKSSGELVVIAENWSAISLTMSGDCAALTNSSRRAA